ncbi:methyltransferase type 11 [Nocardia rhizosphaerae]
MTGDTADMLDARAAFQGAGHFAPIATAITRAFALDPAGGTHSPPDLTPSLETRGTPGPDAPPIVDTVAALPDNIPQRARPADGTSATPLEPTRQATGPTTGNHATRDVVMPSGGPARGETILEVGAGTGYYLAEVLAARPGTAGIALDVAKPAARRAARAHPRLASVLADAWRGLPIRDHVLAGVLSVFAPRNPAEVARVLAPGGRFVVVTPTARHLRELVGPLGMVRVDPEKQRRLAASMAGTFVRVDHTLVEFPMKLSRQDVTRVVAMGPSAFHGTPADDPRIAALPEVTEVTAAVTVSTFVPMRTHAASAR